MEVPDLPVELVFVVIRDQVGDVSLGEVVIITEALGETPDFVLGFVALLPHFGKVPSALRYPTKGCRSEVDALEEYRNCFYHFFSYRARGVDTYRARCRRWCGGRLWSLCGSHCECFHFNEEVGSALRGRKCIDTGLGEHPIIECDVVVRGRLLCWADDNGLGGLGCVDWW